MVPLVFDRRDVPRREPAEAAGRRVAAGRCSASCMVLLIITWQRGTRILVQKTRRVEVPIDALIRSLEKKPPHIVPGTAVFLTSDPDFAPASLLHNLKHNKVLHEHNIILTIVTTDTPRTERGRARRDHADLRAIHPRRAALRLHGGAERAEGARDRAQAGAALRHHVDVVLPVAPLAQGRRRIRHAAWQDRLFIGLRTVRQRRDRLSSRYRPAAWWKSARRSRFERLRRQSCGLDVQAIKQRNQSAWEIRHGPDARALRISTPRKSPRGLPKARCCSSTCASRTRPMSSAIPKRSTCRCRSSIRPRCPIRQASRSCSPAAPAIAR